MSLNDSDQVYMKKKLKHMGEELNRMAVDDGAAQTRPDLWQEAGGRDTILQSFIAHRFSNNISPEQWSSLTITVFNKDEENLRKWLKVIWQQDREGVRTAVLLKGRFSTKMYC